MTDHRARVVAREVESDIVRRGWPVGEVLGSEPELLERYDVSRPVWREAVRILEHLNVARVRMGRGGGLEVAAPNAEAVVRAMAVLLRFEDVPADEVHDARVALELACVDRLVDDLTPERAGVLRAQLHAEEEMAPDELLAAGHGNFHVTVAGLAGNRPVQVFVEVLMELASSPARRLPAGERAALTESARRSHRLIVEAILARDRDAARAATLAHLGSSRDHARRPRGRR